MAFNLLRFTLFRHLTSYHERSIRTRQRNGNFGDGWKQAISDALEWWWNKGKAIAKLQQKDRQIDVLFVSRIYAPTYYLPTRGKQFASIRVAYEELINRENINHLTSLAGIITSLTYKYRNMDKYIIAHAFRVSFSSWIIIIERVRK